ncbi:isoaspartyl peptidase/L-asparaginase [Aliiglaciecola sp. CAU 1673]|uniref:isoaspartyl peptidase/L-asparaginase family protein n=1 Tax=Aliiglaciecola sp. CAU 1673 TaxID=3032595 RepID=UPI0023DACECB|nr:isoaspartyl peptidase/L-asparaginase [Aliiglaciecola sp. CAU 1673]MDF2177581.1 isoaspartyl peptidase/L-asparaginase [Aliiglaciecola sp. CAU 1673]
MKKNIPLVPLILASQLLSGQVVAEDVSIAIHGGAGTLKREHMSPQQEAVYRQKLEEAVTLGHTLLKQGKSAVEAVTETIKILEDSPLFNAGRGAVYTYNGEHELDASIMDGKDRAAGAVAGVKHVKNPITLARLIMEKSDHVFLSGDGAEQFAWLHDIERASTGYFDNEQRYKQLLDVKEKLAFQQISPVHTDYKFGTVGAVARDSQGNLAAATSTGGMTAKRYGRIGDSPVIGAGNFADNQSCAVSATGHGEFFIRYNVAADICARVRYQNIDAKTAADTVINQVLKEAGGEGGVIVVDSKGAVSMPFNTSGMYRASIDTKGKLTVGIFAGE